MLFRLDQQPTGVVEIELLCKKNVKNVAALIDFTERRKFLFPAIDGRLSA